MIAVSQYLCMILDWGLFDVADASFAGSLASSLAIVVRQIASLLLSLFHWLLICFLGLLLQLLIRWQVVLRGVQELLLGFPVVRQRLYLLRISVLQHLVIVDPRVRIRCNRIDRSLRLRRSAVVWTCACISFQQSVCLSHLILHIHVLRLIQLFRSSTQNVDTLKTVVFCLRWLICVRYVLLRNFLLVTARYYLQKLLLTLRHLDILHLILQVCFLCAIFFSLESIKWPILSSLVFVAGYFLILFCLLCLQLVVDVCSLCSLVLVAPCDCRIFQLASVQFKDCAWPGWLLGPCTLQWHWFCHVELRSRPLLADCPSSRAWPIGYPFRDVSCSDIRL